MVSQVEGLVGWEGCLVGKVGWKGWLVVVGVVRMVGVSVLLSEAKAKKIGARHQNLGIPVVGWLVGGHKSPMLVGWLV